MGVKNEGNKAIPWVPKGVDIQNNSNNITKKKGKIEKYLEGFSECAVKSKGKVEILIRLQLKERQLRKLGKWVKMDFEDRVVCL